MKVINKKLVSMLCILVVILSIGIFFICNKSSDKVTLDEVKLKESENESGMFAIMLQSSEGSEDYTQSPEETFPIEGYTFNKEKSGCLDSDGQKITDVSLSYTNGKVTVETGSTSYCYIYFDKVQLKAGEIVQQSASNSELKSSNIGDLTKRFVGTDPKNYICFGNGEKCTTDDNYMYRIIGITKNGELKIQKYNSLGEIEWHDDNMTDVKWNTSNSSRLFKSLNGEGFLDNETYIPQDNKWKDLIVNKTWKIGDINGYGSGYTTNATEVYSKESGTTSDNYKIGLMYLSDYYLAVDGAGTTDCNNEACSSWMFHDEYEWMMSRCGNLGSDYFAWVVFSYGRVGIYDLDIPVAVRPVFYLSLETKIKSATGSSGDPYIVELNND